MIEMTPAARERFDKYLQRMRTELRGARTVVADDVEQSVREHVEIALATANGPVGAAEIDGVLERLGPPERWLAEENESGWDRFRDRLINGPDDWRLAYVAFALFLVAAFLPMIGFFLLIPAMFLSRATVELAQERGEALGARRWLVYPSIAVVLALVVGVLILAPPLRLLAALETQGLGNFDVPPTSAAEFRFDLGLDAVVFGSWWIIAAAFCAAFLRPIRFLFAPLLDGLRRKHFAVLAFIGALVAAGGSTLIYFR